MLEAVKSTCIVTSTANDHQVHTLCCEMWTLLDVK